jgi:hypothetical protein
LTYEEAEESLRAILVAEHREVAREAWLQSMRDSFGVKELITLKDETVSTTEEATVQPQ